MDWLLTWVCQGSALALLVTFVFRVSRTINASTRYLLWWVTLAAVLVLPWAGGLGGALVHEYSATFRGSRPD